MATRAAAAKTRGAPPQSAPAEAGRPAPVATRLPAFDAVPAPDGLIEVARVLGAWGVQGWIKLLPHSADPQALFSTKRWYLSTPSTSDDPPAPGATVQLLKVRQAREHSGSIVAQVDLVTDRDQAQALKGWRIWVPRSSFPTPQADEYYWVDLIGLAVRNRQGVELGRVVELLPTGPQTTLVVRPTSAAPGPSAADVLIPFVSVYVDAVHVAQGHIDVDWTVDE